MIDLPARASAELAQFVQFWFFCVLLPVMFGSRVHSAIRMDELQPWMSDLDFTGMSLLLQCSLIRRIGSLGCAR